MAKDDRTRLIIVGAKGRMGLALVRLAEVNPQLELIAALDRDDSLASVIERTDVLVEFAHHSATVSLASTAAEHGKALVIGTTGHTEEEKQAISAAAKKIPVVFAPNFSVGVNLLFHLARIASQTLDESFDREIIEMHHRHKLDAPSGTAKRLAEILATGPGRNVEGPPSPRPGRRSRSASVAGNWPARPSRRRRGGRSHRHSGRGRGAPGADSPRPPAATPLPPEPCARQSGWLASLRAFTRCRMCWGLG